LTGRGAYTHDDPDCIARALARGGFAYAMRTRIVDTEFVHLEIT
jgi:predicted RNA-binding protein YlxR (DUF448 family)